MTDLKRAIAELAKGGSLTLASLPDGFDAFCVADLTRALEARDRSACGPVAPPDGLYLVKVDY